MTTIFAIGLVVHGLIHLLGFAKAFGLAELRRLGQPISPWLGVLWLFSAVLFRAAATALFAWPREWWAIGGCAIIISMSVVVLSRTDARYVVPGNAIALLGVIFGFLAYGPVSLRANFDRDVERALTGVSPGMPVLAPDLARLPVAVQRYLTAVGVLGQPRVHNVHVRMQGRIRSTRDARWMPLTAEQYNFFDVPERLFYMSASMFTVPAQGYHRYVGASARMTVKAAALVPVVDDFGPEMDQSETVTMFNDMCIMAPATLIDPAIVWESIDPRTVRARFTNAGHTIQAELSFNDDGELVNFWSDDRFQTSPDGKTTQKLRWSTPLGSYRSFGPVRLASDGEARWHAGNGDYAYIELRFDDIQYNVGFRPTFSRLTPVR